MVDELREIMRDAYVRERRLNLLYQILTELDGCSGTDCGFFQKAREDQDGDLQLLLAINQKFGNDDVDPNILERLGENVLHLRSNFKEKDQLVKQVLDAEGHLVELYKSSLRHLTSDDETRKMVNRMLTVKLSHKRDLMDALSMFTR
jgi:hypothetical protein